MYKLMGYSSEYCAEKGLKAYDTMQLGSLVEDKLGYTLDLAGIITINGARLLEFSEMICQ
jgi:hypothetical protein